MRPPPLTIAAPPCLVVLNRRSGIATVLAGTAEPNELRACRCLKRSSSLLCPDQPPTDGYVSLNIGRCTMVKGAIPFIASFVAVSCASATAYGLWHQSDAPASTAAAAASLVEEPHCAAAPIRSTPTAPVAEAEAHGEAEQQLVVVVPPTVILRVDTDGRVVAATTNTGCAPRLNDAWYVIGPDGTAAPAAADAFPQQLWVGDFTQTGVTQAQL